MARTYCIDPVHHAVFDNADPHTRRIIVLLGTHVYEHIPKHELVVSNQAEIEQLSQRHARILEMKEHDICHLHEELSKLKNEIQSLRDNERFQYAKGLEERDMYVNQVKAHMEQEIQRLKEENVSLCRQRQNDLNRYEEHTKSIQETLRNQSEQLTKLVEINDNTRHKTTVELGQQGEKAVETFLGTQFKEGVMWNTTKVDGKGDFHFEYKGVRMLIEVKNITRQISKTQDVDKFLKNVLDTRCDGGIIVNLNDNVRFPYRNDILDWDFHRNIPTLYITHFNSTPHVLYAGILAMYHYIKEKRELERNNNKSAGEHKAKFDELVIFVRTWIPLLEQATKHAKNTMESLQALSNNISTQLSNYTIDLPNLHYGNTQHCYKGVVSTGKEGILEAIGIFYDDHNKTLPKAKELHQVFNIGGADIQTFGGIKHLNKEFLRLRASS